jgi:hypothetical protein
LKDKLTSEQQVNQFQNTRDYKLPQMLRLKKCQIVALKKQTKTLQNPGIGSLHNEFTEIDDEDSLSVAGQEPALGLLAIGDDLGQLDASLDLARVDPEEDDVRLAGLRQLRHSGSVVDGDQVTLETKSKCEEQIVIVICKRKTRVSRTDPF